MEMEGRERKGKSIQRSKELKRTMLTQQSRNRSNLTQIWDPVRITLLERRKRTKGTRTDTSQGSEKGQSPVLNKFFAPTRRVRGNFLF